MEPVTQMENCRRAVRLSYSKTHCVNGHELTEENTRVVLVCRCCSRERGRRARAKQRAMI
jgi:hypothetical protein